MIAYPFKTETDLCAAFLTLIPQDWIAYPETCGFDIVLAHRETGAQIGIEAKLILNPKVLVQAVGYRDRYASGPDFRAVLVGRVIAENAQIASLLGITVLHLTRREEDRLVRSGLPKSQWFIGYDWLPDMAAYKAGHYFDRYSAQWVDEAPVTRLALPDYVPEVAAGVPSPRKLSHWTIQAIKLCILIGRIGTVTRAHFEALKLSPSRWCDGRWLQKGTSRGHWSPGPHFPGERFRQEHPVSWGQIEADWPKWGEPIVAKAGVQGALL